MNIAKAHLGGLYGVFHSQIKTQRSLMGLRIVKKNPDSLPVALLYGYVCKKSLCDRLKLRSDECEA